jgi:hypothetical protein
LTTSSTDPVDPLSKRPLLKINPDVAKNHIIQQTGMLEKLSSGHLVTLNMGFPSI